MFTDKTYMMYSPKSIKTIDGTNLQDPLSLNTFFLDLNIIEIAQATFTETELNKKIYANYPHIATKMWSNNNHPDSTKQFGFP